LAEGVQGIAKVLEEDVLWCRRRKGRTRMVLQRYPDPTQYEGDELACAEEVEKGVVVVGIRRRVYYQLC
jgi:hypothetical protein